ncbi:MAG: hypothetical protein OXO50_16740 [Caldilineaceae bacterium]|nr:hypothetical protein [Caldilineaceae bacterium]
MGHFDLPTIASVASMALSMVSIVLAIVAIWLGTSSERKSKENFERTQDLMNEHSDMIKNTLALVDARTESIKETVDESNKELLNSMTSVVDRILPQTPDPNEQMAHLAFAKFLEDPQGFAASMETIQELPNPSSPDPRPPSTKSSRSRKQRRTKR